jgi:hypothetical protein
MEEMLYDEIVKSKQQGELTEFAKKLLIEIFYENFEKFLLIRSRLVDEYDCLSYVKDYILKWWNNFNHEKYKKAKPFFTELTKRGMMSYYNISKESYTERKFRDGMNELANRIIKFNHSHEIEMDSNMIIKFNYIDPNYEVRRNKVPVDNTEYKLGDIVRCVDKRKEKFTGLNYWDTYSIIELPPEESDCYDLKNNSNDTVHFISLRDYKLEKVQ